LRNSRQFEVKYGPANFPEQYAIVDNFNSTYWSGIQIRCYFGRTKLVDVIQFNYQVLEQVRPYYGYASYVPNRLHHGTRLIAGEFTVNFTSEAYFFSLLEKIRRDPNAGALLPTTEEESTRDHLPPMDYSKLGVESGTDLANLPIDSQKRIIDSYRKAFRNPNIPIPSENGRYSPVIRNNQGLFEITDPATGARRNLDLTILYGADLKDGLVLNMLNAEGEYYADNATTLADLDSDNSLAPLTGIKLKGVSILGQAKSMDDSGRPIVETYSFQAKNIQIITAKHVFGSNREPNPTSSTYNNQIREGLT
jgi:hypothetical protein